MTNGRHGTTRMHLPSGGSLLTKLTTQSPSQTVTSRGPNVVQSASGEISLHGANQLPVQAPTSNGAVRYTQPSIKATSFTAGQARSIGNV